MIKKCQSCNREYNEPEDFLKGTSRWRICSEQHLWFNCNCNSTLVLKKGNYDWYRPDMFMSQRAAGLFNSLSNKNLIPNIPSAVMEVQQLIADESSTSLSIGAALKKDPILSGTVLGAANNLKSRSLPPIQSIEHAASYVGRKTLNELVSIASLRVFTCPTKVFNTGYFWNEALLTGCIAEHLASKYGVRVTPDDAYVAGSLVNIGKLIGGYVFSDITDKIYLDLLSPKKVSNWKAVEAKYPGIDHRVLGEIAVAFWGLPTFVLEVVTDHHNFSKVLVGQSPKGKLKMLDLVASAVQLSHFVSGHYQQVDELILDRFKKQIELDSKSFFTLSEELQKLQSQVIDTQSKGA